MNKVVFGKYQEKVTKQRYKTCHSKKKKESFSIRTKFSYYKVFHRKFISNRNEKTEVLMNKSVCLGLSIIELSEVVMIIQFWYDYIKPKYGEKAKLCYMDTDSFIVYLNTDDILKTGQKMLKAHSKV